MLDITDPPEHPAVQTAYCLTVYNEPGRAILASLASLANAISYQQQRDPTPQEAFVTIIADGSEKISASAMQLFTAMGLLKSRQQILNSGTAYTNSSFDHRILSELARHAYSSSNTDVAPNDHWHDIYQQSLQRDHKSACEGDATQTEFRPSLSITLFIKDVNKGKLDSHAWFFGHFCNQIHPKHCFQLDAGTAPHQDALHVMHIMLEANPTLGALASRVQTLRPRNHYNLLLTWQYTDFFVQKILDWPAEVRSGYLTVIPGQFCAFRWDAITYGEANSEQHPTSALSQYFRGLGPLSPMEATMFLAEDRILGFEIISRRNSQYTIGYANKAEATTDPCYRLSELMGQRRRWINSSFACNLHTIRNAGAYFRNCRARATRRHETIAAIPWLAITGLIQWFMPTLMCILYISLAARATPADALYSPLVLTFILTVAAQVIGFSRSQFSKLTMSRIAAFTGILQIMLFITCIIRFSIEQQTAAIALLPLSWIVFIYTSATIASTTTSARPSKSLLYYPFLTPFFMLALTTYAICNCNDLSWGTKGLTQTTGSPSKSMTTGGTRQERLFRTRTISFWLACNIGAVGLFMYPTSPLKQAIGVTSYLLIWIYTVFKGVSGLAMAIETRTASL